MKSITTFFQNITTGKKVLLLLTPIITTVLSMKALLLGLIIFIILDLFTGIRKTLHKKGTPFNPFKLIFYKSIKSYLLRQTWRKAYEYGIGIIVIVVLETLVLGAVPISLIGKTFTISELAVVVACCVEVWSLFENMEAVSGRNLLKKLQGLLPEKLANIFNSKSNNGKRSDNTGTKEEF